MSRILTDAEILDIVWKEHCSLANLGNTHKAVAEAQDTKTEREVRKEIGEWLDTKWVSYGEFAFIKLSDEEMKALKRGEKPK